MPNPSRSVLLPLAALLSLVSPAWAYLGGFEAADGYTVSEVRDVSTFNAGQYGTLQGGSFGLIPQNTGLFYKSDTGRVGVGEGELVTHPGEFRTGASALILRSNTGWGDGIQGSGAENDPSSWDSPPDGANYLYSFDAFDFGANPASVTTGTIDINFWICAQAWWSTTGTFATTEFVNAQGDTVFGLGVNGTGVWQGPGELQYYDANGWQDTGIEMSQSAWDNVQLSFNLDTDTVSLNYLVGPSNTLHSIVTGASAAATMNTLAGIRFTAAPNTEKQSYDDFTITASAVPEPSSALLLAMVGAMGVLSRRR